jgi:hypothetical protein
VEQDLFVRSYPAEVSTRAGVSKTAMVFYFCMASPI